MLLLRMALTIIKYSCIYSEHCLFPYNRLLAISNLNISGKGHSLFPVMANPWEQTILHSDTI